ncbi:MAG: MBL fold metallo-hydrolase [Actinomycetota bacterium]
MRSGLVVRKLSHASLDITGWGGSLVTDPWFIGRAFADAWSHSFEPAPDAWRALECCRYIWISHGHPDHFSPETLLRIPSESRSKIEILIADTVPNRPLLGWFTKYDFAVVPLKSGREYELEGELRATVGEVHFGDSWLHLFFGDTSLLNINDCVLRSHDIAKLQRRYKGVDLVAVQYGVANWTGNLEDVDERSAAAAAVLDRVRTMVRALEPQRVLPFASEFEFCHKENVHLNSEQNDISDVTAVVNEFSVPVVQLANGDEFDLAQSTVRRMHPQSPRKDHEPIQQKSVGISELQRTQRSRLESTAGFHGKIRSWIYFRLIERTRLGRIVVATPDTAMVFELTATSIKEVSISVPPNIVMSSEMFAELIGKPYGLDNLFIGGRFIRKSQDALLRLGVILGLDRLRTMGFHFGPSLVLRPGLLFTLLERLLSRRWTSVRQ